MGHHLAVRIHPTFVARILALVAPADLVLPAFGVLATLGPSCWNSGRSIRGSQGHFIALHRGNALVAPGASADGAVSDHSALGVDAASVTRALALLRATRLVLSAVGVLQAFGAWLSRRWIGRRSDHFGALHLGIAFVAFETTANGPVKHHFALGIGATLVARVPALLSLAHLVLAAVGVLAALGRSGGDHRRWKSGDASDSVALDSRISFETSGAGADGPMGHNPAVGVDAARNARTDALEIATGHVVATVVVGGAFGPWRQRRKWWRYGRHRNFVALHPGITLISSDATTHCSVQDHLALSVDSTFIARVLALLGPTDLVLSAVRISSALRWESRRNWSSGRGERGFVTLHFGIALVAGGTGANGPVKDHLTISVDATLIARTLTLPASAYLLGPTVRVLDTHWTDGR